MKKATTNLLMLGGLVALGVFLARKKKAEAAAAAAAAAAAPKPAATGNYVLV